MPLWQSTYLNPNKAPSNTISLVLPVVVEVGDISTEKGAIENRKFRGDLVKLCFYEWILDSPSIAFCRMNNGLVGIFSVKFQKRCSPNFFQLAYLTTAKLYSNAKWSFS